MKGLSIFILFGLLGWVQHLKAQQNPGSERPNIVLILVDDSGLMDFGAFGGEAKTPIIDSLARAGIMFTNMHASPVCAPSRAMLMTGSDSHLAGVANLPEMLPKKYQEKKGYEGVLNDSVQTIATRLKELKYNTYASGKWHLGHDEYTLPTKRGFDRSFVLGGSGADNYTGKGYLPFKPNPEWYEDGRQTDLPDEFYSSELFVDKMIRFHEEEKNPDQPFFSYLAFLAVHTPVQAPKAYVKKYQAVYEKGWDAIRQQRYTKAREMGILPKNGEMNPMLEGIKPWEELSEAEKKSYVNGIAVMAGMLEAMDFHIGRYVQYLKEKGLAENTLFIITSDNGPDGGDYSGINGWAKRHGYHRDLHGDEGNRYYGFIGPGYASAIAAPFSHFKYYTGEGGLRVPLIMSGPRLPASQIDPALCFITYIAPTIYDLLGLSPSANKGYHPIMGKSMLPHIKDNSLPIYAADEGVGMEAAGCAAYFMGDYKIVQNKGPRGDGLWKMYNLAKDPAETQDISAIQPMIFQILLCKYEEYKKEVGVQDMPEGYSAEGEVAKKSMKAILNPFK